jgi:microcystin-dependent protein
MASFRDDGVEFNVKADVSEFSTPTGERFTVFGVTAVSPSGRYYAAESGKQMWLVDSSGGIHELTAEWLETKVAETSAKLDFIYPAVTAFMSAGLLFRNSSTVQTVSSDLNLIGTISVSGNLITSDLGSLITNGPVAMNADASANANFRVYGELDFAKAGTPDTLENIVPFFIRSSANAIQPQGWIDPRLLVVGNVKIYDEFKQSDRGLRFTVLNRETFQIVHDEVYDTAGSQTRPPLLAYDMFLYMNDSKNVGILNSRESWEALIWRKETAETYGMSASDISAAYSNLTIGSLVDQFDRFGLTKAIRASQIGAGEDASGAGSQYCAIFEGSDIYVDSTVPSAVFSVVYPTNRALESWIPFNTRTLPVSGSTQRAQLVGWFMKPRQLDISNNIADRSAPFVASPYGRDTDAVREVAFVNKDAAAGSYNVKIDNNTVDVLTVSFNVTGGKMDLTDHILKNLGYARIDQDGDAVNVAFSKVVTPIGAVLDFAGSTAPSNFLMCDGSALAISASDYTQLYNVIGTVWGAVYDISANLTHFLLPNAAGRVGVGAGLTTVTTAASAFAAYTYTLGMSGGEDKHAQTIDEMARHNHTAPFNAVNFEGNSNPSLRPGGATATSFAGSGVPFNIMQPYLVFNKIIRYK